jgi:hypothetical protein
MGSATPEKEIVVMKRTFVGVAIVALLVIPAAASAQSSRPTQSKPAAKPAQSSRSVDDRRGDVGVGYTFMHEDGASLPAGFVVTGSMRTSRMFDAVAEIGLNHGSVVGVGVNVMTFSGGMRANIPMQGAGNLTPYAQLVTGLVRASASQGGVSATVNGWNLQPGFGVNFAVNDQWSMRPQFDVLIERFNGGWGNDIRFGVIAAYKIK